MRRKPGTLLPLEEAVLGAGLDLRGHGQDEFHGFLIAKRLKEVGDARSLVAHGTLYKALDRMRRQGLLDSRWENPQIAAAERRPRRRLYTVTASGQRAFAAARRARSQAGLAAEGWAPA